MRLTDPASPIRIPKSYDERYASDSSHKRHVATAVLPTGPLYINYHVSDVQYVEFAAILRDQLPWGRYKISTRFANNAGHLVDGVHHISSHEHIIVPRHVDFCRSGVGSR